jgi:hypothetical protein
MAAHSQLSADLAIKVYSFLSDPLSDPVNHLLHGLKLYDFRAARLR